MVRVVLILAANERSKMPVTLGYALYDRQR
jgi:hypothetical protein